MPKNHLALDIETVPIKKLEEYRPVIRDAIQGRVMRRQERDPEFDYNYFASIHGDFGKIICISIGYITEDDTIRLKSFAGDDEALILRQFNEILARPQGIFIHYNGLNFDIPFILQRMAYHGLSAANSSFANLRRFSSDPHFDVMMMYYNWDLSRALPLGILAELHGISSPKEELSGDKIYQTYLEGNWAKIVRYCEYDAATALNLWRKIFRNLPPVGFDKYLFSR